MECWFDKFLSLTTKRKQGGSVKYISFIFIWSVDLRLDICLQGGQSRIK